MFIEPSTLAVAAWDLYEKREKIKPAWKKMRYWIRHGHLMVPIFGAGGTGKTTLGHFLSGSFTPGTGIGPYKVSLPIEEFKLKGDIVCSLIVPPGQEKFKHTWKALYNGLA